MAKITFDRVCYRHGIEKTENKCIELHAFCNCGACSYRKMFVNKGLPNQLTVTVTDESKVEEAKDYISNWKCGQKEHTSEAQYVIF